MAGYKFGRHWAIHPVRIWSTQFLEELIRRKVSGELQKLIHFHPKKEAWEKETLNPVVTYVSLVPMLSDAINFF